MTRRETAEVCREMLDDARYWLCNAVDGDGLSFVEHVYDWRGGQYLDLCKRAYEVCKAPIEVICSGEVDRYNRHLDVMDMLKSGYDGWVPIGIEAGPKLELLFYLYEYIEHDFCLELAAWKIVGMTREEAVYWLGRAMYDETPGLEVDWARRGLALMLGGDPKDLCAVKKILVEEFR